MSPRVSVLIPTYNCARFLGQALDSVLAQTWQDFEVIVVDDGSTDHTAEVAAACPGVRYVWHEHRGISATRNLALSLAQGELIAFLDADDLWESDKLEKQVAYLDAHPDCQLVFTQIRNFYDGAPETISQRQEQVLQAVVEQCLPSCCVRRTVFEQYGGFPENCAYGEDTHWVARLRVGGVDTSHCLKQVLYLRRIHEGNVSLTHRVMDRKAVAQTLASAIRQAQKRQE